MVKAVSTGGALSRSEPGSGDHLSAALGAACARHLVPRAPGWAGPREFGESLSLFLRLQSEVSGPPVWLPGPPEVWAVAGSGPDASSPRSCPRAHGGRPRLQPRAPLRAGGEDQALQLRGRFPAERRSRRRQCLPG